MLKNAFIYFVSFIWIMMTCSFMALPPEYAGANMNGFLAFLLFIVFMVLTVKMKSFIPAILSTILCIVLHIVNFGLADSTMNYIGDFIGAILCIVIFGTLFKNFIRTSRQERDDFEKYKDDLVKNHIPHCPRCKSRDIYLRKEPHYDSNGRVLYYSDIHVCGSCHHKWY